MLQLIDRPVLQGWVRRCLEGPISRPGGWNQGVEDMRYERLGEGCTRESSEVLYFDVLVDTLPVTCAGIL